MDYSKLSKEQTDMGLAIAKAAEKHGLNPDFVIPLFMGESGLAHIPSKKTDSAGKPIAFGVAQLTPATAARYGVPDYMSPDAEANIDAGVRYLKDLMKNKAIGNDPEKIIIGYNAGAGAPFLKSGNLEDLLPETINCHASRQRILRGQEPSREVEAIGTLARSNWLSVHILQYREL